MTNSSRPRIVSTFWFSFAVQVLQPLWLNGLSEPIDHRAIVALHSLLAQNLHEACTFSSLVSYCSHFADCRSDPARPMMAVICYFDRRDPTTHARCRSIGRGACQVVPSGVAHFCLGQFDTLVAHESTPNWGILNNLGHSRTDLRADPLDRCAYLALLLKALRLLIFPVVFFGIGADRHPRAKPLRRGLHFNAIEP